MSPSAHLAAPRVIWTIGHSTRPIDDFLGLLSGSRIEVVADVRSFPGSRKYPQYGREALAATLGAHTIGYHWLAALGGRRRVLPDSPNTAWRNASFRGYADYMSGEGFATGLAQLLEVCSKARTAMMCSEAVWWRCHRSMPRTQSASAIIERWQRHQTASAHIIAVRAIFATSSSWTKPCANSGVAI